MNTFIKYLFLVVTSLFILSCEEERQEPEEELPDGWQEIASPNQYRTRHATVVMADGKVMISGGDHQEVEENKRFPINTSEIYDPETDSWSQAADMNSHRIWHTMVLLADDRILAFGGYNQTLGGDYSEHGEIYDPVSDTWTRTSNIPTETFPVPTMLLMPNGHVLIVGKSAAYTYDPNTDTYEHFKPISYPNHNLSGAQILKLNDSLLMLVGGGGIDPNRSSLLIENGERTYYTTNFEHSYVAAIQLPNKNVIISQGAHASKDRIEIFDMEKKEWLASSPMLPMLHGKFFHRNDGTVFAVGDYYLQEYNHLSDTWTRLECPVAYWGNGHLVPAVQLQTGQIFLTGGFTLEERPELGRSNRVIDVHHGKSYIYTP